MAEYTLSQEQKNDSVLWTVNDKRRLFGAQEIREKYTESEYEKFLRTPIEGAVEATEDQIRWFLQKIFHPTPEELELETKPMTEAELHEILAGSTS